MGYDTQDTRWSMRQAARLAIALYFIAMAMGIVECLEGCELFENILPAQMRNSLFSIGLFTLAYFLLIGQHLRLSSLSLLALVLFSRLNTPFDGSNLSLVRDTILCATLVYTGGFFAPERLRQEIHGRIRLTRVKSLEYAQRNANATVRSHAFSQSPDEMTGLFDQIAEAR